METVNQENTADITQQEERTFTQTEMNAIIQERVARERGKYADYDDLKAKAAQYDEAQKASKSDLQKAVERANALQSQLDALNKANEVAGIPAKEYILS